MLMTEKRYDEAVEAYNIALNRVEKITQDHWTIFYARAICYERLGKWDKAEPDFFKALELRPGQPDVMNYLGYSWLVLDKNYKKAERMKRDDAKRTQDAKDNLTELEKEKALLKEKMGNTRMFGKFLGVGGLLISSQFIKPDFTAAQAANIEAQGSDDDSFEARMRRGASNVLGPDVAAGVEAGVKFLDPGIQMAAELGPEALRPSRR